MPRDGDDDTKSKRPPARRGPPSRGGDARGDKGRSGAKRPGGGFRKDRSDAPRGEARDRPAGKRFGGKPAGERKFGDKRPFAAKGAGFRKDGDRPPRREFSRDGAAPRPPRSGDDRPARAYPRDDRPKRDFRAKDESGGERRPRSDAPRPSFRKDGDRPPRRDDSRSGERPRSNFGQDKDRPRTGRFKRDDSRGDFKRGEGRSPDRGPRKEFGSRDAGAGKKPWESRSSAPRSDARRSERPERDGRRDERGPPRDGAKRFDRPRGDSPFRGKPRDDRGKRRDDRGGAKRGDGPPRFARDRDDRVQSDRPKTDRPRTDRIARSSHTWREHPRSEETVGTPERMPERRPAFGGRGEYRERKPERDLRAREPAEAAPKAKKAGERIAKVMARAGLCSRRDAEEWIRQERVTVNGRLITSPALDVTSNDTILIDNAPLPERERTRLFLYHKPKGLVTTHADPEGRPTVFDSLPEGLPRLISVGRLDFNTEGLLLLTNDGGLARVLELPDTGWLRRYRVRAHGDITQERLDELRKGVEVEGIKYGAIEATLERDSGANVWILFAIREGKNREVRNVMTHLGLEVNRLIRVSYGPFQLGEIAEGQVEEVRSRLLRDQLGERIATAANADFKLPARGEAEGDDATASPAAPLEKPRKRSGLIADRKGRRVLVERSGRTDTDNDAPPRGPSRSYKGKRGRTPRDK